MRILRNTSDVFEALGGTAEVAEIAGATYSAAHNWKAFGRFPPRKYVVLQRELARMGLAAPDSLWGMDE